MTIEAEVATARSPSPAAAVAGALGAQPAAAGLAQLDGLALACVPRLSTALRALVDAGFGASPAQALDALVAALDGSADATSVRKIVPDGLWPLAQDEWNALKAKLVQRLPDKVKPLAAQLRDLGDAQPLPLVATGAADSIGPYFNVGGDLSAALEAQSSNAFDPSLADGGAVQASEAALRLGVAGKIGLKGAGKYTQPWGGVSIDAGATAQALLDFWFVRPKDEYLAAALSSADPRAFEPWSLASLRAARAAGFRRAALDLDGKLEMRAAFNAGAVAQYQYGAGGLLSSPIALNVQAGAQAKLSAAIEGRYALRIDVAEVGDVSIAVERSRKADRSASIELGVDAKIDGLAEQADAIVARILPSASNLLAQLDKYSDPVRVLKDEIERRIAASLGGGALKPYADSLALLVLGDTSAAKVTGEITDAITRAATGRIDDDLRALMGGGGARDAVITRAGAALTEWLGPAAAPAIMQAVTAEFGPAITQVTQELDARITSEVQKAGAALAQLLQPLQAVGQQVDALQAAARKDATAALQPVKDFLQRYAKLRDDVADALRKAGTERFSAKLAASMTRSADDRAIVNVRLGGSQDYLDEFLHQLWLGRLDLSLVIDAAGNPRPGVTRADGTFTETLAQETRAALAVDFLGFAGLDQVRALSNVVVTRDVTGRVTVAETSGAFEEVTQWFDWVKTARIDFTCGARIRDGGITVDAPQLTILYSMKEEDLALDDALAYLDGLVRAGLLSRGGYGEAKDLLARGATRQDQHLANAAIDLRMGLGENDWRAWLDHSDDQLFAIFCDAFVAAALASPLPGWDFRQALSLATGDGGDALQTFRDLALLPGDNNIVMAIYKKTGLNVDNRADLGRGVAQDIAGGMRVLRQCALAVGGIRTLTPLWRRYVKTAIDGLSSSSADVAAQLDQVGRQLLPQFAKVIQSAQTVVGNEKAVPVLTTGFVLGMLRATGRDAQLVPIHLAYEENGTHEFVVV
jgi:hypothetical protein